MKQAAILDIGSNSIRYACGRLDAAGHAALEPKQIRTTRLAEGLDASGRLSEAAMRRSLEAIEAFATDAACRGLPLFAYATSAVRDSANRADFCGRAAALGVEIEILDGLKEGETIVEGPYKAVARELSDGKPIKDEKKDKPAEGKRS